MAWKNQQLREGGGAYSYICVHRPQKQSISQEIDCAKHEYTNMNPPQEDSQVLFHDIHFKCIKFCFIKLVINQVVSVVRSKS